MSKALVIAKRDFVSLVTSPMYWSILGFCSLIWSGSFIRIMYAFIQQQAMQGGNNLHMTVILSHISWVNVILLFCIPILTMRLFAEEKAQHTFDLLLTSPVNSTQITIAKVLSGYLIVVLMIAISFLYPISIMFMADVEIWPLLVGYLGLSLMSLVYVCVGAFSSSLTSSVLLSAVIAIVLNLGIFIVSGLGESFSGTGFSKVLLHLDLNSHFWQFMKGVISIKSLVLLLSVSLFFIFLTQRVVESTRWRS